jgi:hypothetical protein
VVDVDRLGRAAVQLPDAAHDLGVLALPVQCHAREKQENRGSVWREFSDIVDRALDLQPCVDHRGEQAPVVGLYPGLVEEDLEAVLSPRSEPFSQLLRER